MGTILASAIISKASIVLQDVDNDRWSQAELLGWLNDGQRAIVIAMPELTATYGNITLVAGTKQSLPGSAITLMGNMRNMGSDGNTPGRPVREVKRHVLDAQVPDWHTMTASASVRHYVYDNRNTKSFFVYPPATVGTKVEAQYAVSPTDVASTSSAITLDDVFEPVLLDYVLYRAFGKDIEVAGNGERSGTHLQAFTTWLSAKKNVDASTQPPNGSTGP